MTLLLFLINGFAAFYCINNFIKSTSLFSMTIPIFCVISNFYLGMNTYFWYNAVLPSLVLGILFIMCCGLFVNFIND